MNTLIANPFFANWDLPYQAPPFDHIRAYHFSSAFEHGLDLHRAEVMAIQNHPEPPSFENVICAMERAGLFLDRVSSIFYNLVSTDGDDDMQAIEREMAPRLAAHASEIFTNPVLYARIHSLYQTRETLGLDQEQLRVLEQIHLCFQRSGAHLPEPQRVRMREIAERLASLSTQFAQNVLRDEAEYLLSFEEAMAQDLPPSFRSAAAQLAQERQVSGPYAVNLSRSNVEPFLTYVRDRALRATLYSAWTTRGGWGQASDNHDLIHEIIRLRQERARLLGFRTFAHFKLEDTMAGSAEAVQELLGKVWPAGKKRAIKERAHLQKLMAKEYKDEKLAAYDWRYYAEKWRKHAYDFDEADLRPYFQLDSIRAAAFDVAHRLFGITFKERHDLPVYHKDVRVFDVRGPREEPVALFYVDDFARPTKRGGAWMSSFRNQKGLDGKVCPHVMNVLNLTPAAPGQPVLLTLDEVRTLFHEFGHALHGILSDVTYPWLAGTAVSTDFVELPSQLYEHWSLEPAVLSKFARHYQTHEPLPQALIDKVVAAKTFNQGFLTVEYCACALLDLELHLADPEGLDIEAFEKQIMEKIGMPPEIGMRHRPPHFTHIFSNEGYACGYYSYLWSEVLDADAFDAFVEKGDIFDPTTAGKLKEFIYAAGNRRNPQEAYVAFRGHPPHVAPLLRKRGLQDVG